MSAKDLRQQLADDRALRIAKQDLRNFMRKRSDAKAARPVNPEAAKEQVQHSLAVLQAASNRTRTAKPSDTPASSGIPVVFYAWKEGEVGKVTLPVIKPFEPLV